MKKVKKTYGVRGFMEYQTFIKVGKSSVKVTFTGGSATSNSQPATYSTDSLMMQFAIERSDEYKKKKIMLIRTIALDEDVYIESEHVALASNAAAEAETAEDTAQAADEVAEETVAAVAEETTETEETVAENATVDETATETIETVTELEFTCNDDAKDYLEEHYGVDRKKIRTRAQIIEAGKSYGLDITFVD